MDLIKRNREIIVLKDCGQSYRSIAINFGISPKRVEQIYKREKQHIISEKIHNDAILDVCETGPQATRLFRCLDRAGILREIEIDNGSLDSYSDETLLGIRNFGLTFYIGVQYA